MYKAVYVDFGNDEAVPKDRLRPLHKQFALYPPLALRMSLSEAVVDQQVTKLLEALLEHQIDVVITDKKSER